MDQGFLQCLSKVALAAFACRCVKAGCQLSAARYGFLGMLTMHQWAGVAALVVLALTLVWLIVRPRRRRVRYVPVGLMGRRYIVWLPIPRKQPGPVPVVLAFHADGSTVEQLEVQMALHMSRAAARFITVYPEGYHRSWNAGSCCGDANKSGIDEATFVHAILDDLGSLLEIDRRRIYATGFSNGAMLCYYLACNMADEIAAIAPVNGSMAVASCAPKRAVPILHFEGVADERAAGEPPALADTIAFWRGANSLDRATHMQVFGGGADCTIYSGANSDAEIRVCLIQDPLGRWLGSAENTGVDASGGSSPAAILRSQVNEAVFEFFAGKSLSEVRPRPIRIRME
jgi:polyhydroxybutyrate depolymerase